MQSSETNPIDQTPSPSSLSSVSRDPSPSTNLNDSPQHLSAEAPLLALLSLRHEGLDDLEITKQAVIRLRTLRTSPQTARAQLMAESDELEKRKPRKRAVSKEEKQKAIVANLLQGLL